MMPFKFGARDHRSYLETKNIALMAFGDSKMIISQTECTWGPFSAISLQTLWDLKSEKIQRTNVSVLANKKDYFDLSNNWLEYLLI